MKKIKRKFLKNCLIFLISFVIITKIPVTTSLKDNNCSDILDKGWVETIDGIKVLHVNGSNYEMGYQHGYYLKDEYMICHRAWLNYTEKTNNLTLDDLIDIWNAMNSSFPQEYKEEIRGLADAVGLSFEEVAAMETIGVAIYWKEKCCVLAAWGNATEDGKLLHISSGDFPINIEDPETGILLSDCQIIIVREPDNGFSSVNFALPTGVGTDGGVNEKGIVLSYTALYTDNFNITSIPLGLRLLMVMDHVSSAEDAVDIINSNRTIGWSIIIGDSKIPIGYALEQHANYSYAGTWDNPVEGNYPSWTIDHVVRRGNLFLDPDSAGIDPDLYNKSNFFRWMTVKLIKGLADNIPFVQKMIDLFDIKFEKSYYMKIKHFTVLSKTFEKHWGELNLQNSMKLLRKFYNGFTDPAFFFFQNIAPKTYSKNWHQWVICPETGDILVSFSQGQRSAHKCSVHYFNIYDLFNSKN
jgi:hypothetical protein